ncbi:protoporphyrinogen/coproporphyrinogen oxidase [Pseudonocardia bannensis]|uniref:FAD-dependent oxidoreductase n=1 Tax=Pseudonocardia bannensis TaxID=630973 RepID=A0A848DGB2_9PSEU|nr:FAD-dependent oxidoreductase [Pseudonocardia bannensis]NMH91616.1 FAD-dependent oxidoreductase [Pseudonocardia bannensis]
MTDPGADPTAPGARPSTDHAADHGIDRAAGHGTDRPADPGTGPGGDLGADLVVLGAGPAGLAAAWRAARAGRSVVLLERGDAVGGMAASFDVAGIRVDHGSHRLHPSIDPGVLADLAGLLGDDLQLRPRNGRLQVGGAWVGFPLRPAELVRRLPRGLVARIAADTAAAPLRRRSAPPASYADALRRSLGPGLYGALYAPFAEKLWGRSGEEIDAEQARRRVTADTPWKIAARMLHGARDGQGRMFRYPRRGFGQLTDAVAAAATDAGARIELRTEAVSLSPGADGVTVRTNGGAAISAGHVFSTVPLTALARIVDPGPPADVLADAADLKFRAMVLVYLVLEGRRPWTTYDAHYLPGAGTPVTRVSEPANYRDSADDPADRTVLCAEIPCAPDDAIWNATDDDLAARVADDLVRAGLPPVRPAAVVTRRLRHVYPVYETGFGARLAGLDAWASSLPGMTTFGRLGLFAHDNTHHAFVMAYDAVDALTGPSSGFDEQAWATARKRFATHVVED